MTFVIPSVVTRNFMRIFPYPGRPQCNTGTSLTVVGRQPVPGEKIIAGQPFQALGKAITRRLGVDIDFAHQPEIAVVVEGTHGNIVIVAGQEMKKQVAAACLAKTPLAPLGGGVATDMLFALPRYTCRRRGKSRAAHPAPAHTAMTGVVMGYYAGSCETHFAAQTAATLITHLCTLVSDTKF